jgi:glycosyltransferase involved in cell wall biosynthesis
MIYNKRIIVVLPAFNAEKTLLATLNDIPFDIVDDVILVDDCSSDNTFELAKSFGLNYVYKHDSNLGYGANQKTCYKKAIELNADIVIMLHPDYQYTPKLIESFSYIIANNVYPVVLGSRILGKGALKGGMPMNIILATELFLVISLSQLILNTIQMILFSIIKFLRKYS